MAVSGSESRWDELHEICTERTRADALARMLERHAHQGNEAAMAWAHVLAEIHPGLKVNLAPPPPSSDPHP